MSGKFPVVKKGIYTSKLLKIKKNKTRQPIDDVKNKSQE